MRSVALETLDRSVGLAADDDRGRGRWGCGWLGELFGARGEPGRSVTQNTVAVGGDHVFLCWGLRFRSLATDHDKRASRKGAERDLGDVIASVPPFHTDESGEVGHHLLTS